jgi:NitT/TauT family transport system substrate-binding protein
LRSARAYAALNASAYASQQQGNYIMFAVLRIPVLSSILLALVGPAFAQGNSPLRTLVVTEPVHGIGYLPLYVAIQKGFFANEGLEIKTVTIESGSAPTNAVLSGQAFAFIAGPEHNAFAKLKGAELRVIVNVVNRGNLYYTATKGKEPLPGTDLGSYFKGKIIAVGPYGGTPNSITRFLIKKWGLDVKNDVALLEVTTAGLSAAVKGGNAQIAAAPYSRRATVTPCRATAKFA